MMDRQDDATALLHQRRTLVGLGVLSCVVTGLLVGIELVVVVARGAPELGELLPRLLVVAAASVLAVAIRRRWNRSGVENEPSTSAGALGGRR